ncbi:hypothetical protein ACFL46_02435 [Candidatus Neomarinimicrobiota bacterium]
MQIINITNSISLLAGSLLIIGNVVVSSCSDIYSQDSFLKYSESIVGVDSVSVNAISGTDVNFSVYCTVGDPCWEFSSASSHFDRHNIYTSISARRDKESICAQVISVLKTDVTISAINSGENYFSFWQANDQYLTIQVEIP